MCKANYFFDIAEIVTKMALNLGGLWRTTAIFRLAFLLLLEFQKKHGDVVFCGLGLCKGEMINITTVGLLNLFVGGFAITQSNMNNNNVHSKTFNDLGDRRTKKSHNLLIIKLKSNIFQGYTYHNYC